MSSQRAWGVVNAVLLITALAGFSLAGIAGKRQLDWRRLDRLNEADFFVVGTDAEVALPLSSRPALVFVFSPRCPFCQTAAPTWSRFMEEHPQVQVLGVSMAGDQLAEVERFLQEHNLDFPVVQGLPHQLEKAVGVSAVPSYLVVSAGGRNLHTLRTGGLLTGTATDSIMAALEQASAPR